MKTINPDKILFRCHGLSDLMTDGQGKSKQEQYDEAKMNLTKYQNDYSLIANKQSKSAQKKLEQIKAVNNKILHLELTKGQFEPSDTCRKRLLKVYAKEVHGREQKIQSKYFTKGIAQEHEAITVLSRNLEIAFNKNTERLNNEFVSGEVDTFIGKELRKAKHTYDTKCSWSYDTFLNAHFQELNEDYEWQGDGYMWLTGAEQHTVAYCLVNGTYKIIQDEKWALAKQYGIIDLSVSEDKDFVEGCKQAEINHIFDINKFYQEYPNYEFHNEVELVDGVCRWAYDIPVQKRMHLKTFERRESRILQAKERIIDCRKWMGEKLFKPQL